MKHENNIALMKERADQEIEQARQELLGFAAVAKSERTRNVLKAAIETMLAERKRSGRRRVRNVEAISSRKQRRNKKLIDQNRKTMRTAKCSRQRWTKGQDKTILSMLKQDDQIALVVGRSIRAIRARRHVLKKKEKAFGSR